MIFFHLRHQTATRRLSFLCLVSSWTDCWPPPDAGLSLPDQTLEEHPEKLKNRRDFLKSFELKVKLIRHRDQCVCDTTDAARFLKAQKSALDLFYLCWSALFWRVFWTCWRSIFVPEAESRSPPAPAAPWSSAPSPLTVTQHHNIQFEAGKHNTLMVISEPKLYYHLSADNIKNEHLNQTVVCFETVRL